MADPYEVLGLGPDASIDDAEEAYHHRLLRCHPDLHASEGPEAVARAEAETLALNEAIHEIRHGYRPTRRTTSRASSSSGGVGGSRGNGFGQRARTEDPWPGSAERGPDRAHRPVPCPFCDEPVTSLDDFEQHLARRHPEMTGLKPRRPSRSRAGRSARPGGWWPMPLWLVAIVNLAFVLVVIAVVAALGGHFAVLRMLPGDLHIRECQRGELVHVREFGMWRYKPCDPDEWIWTYLFVGMLITPFVAVWRWTTRGRD